MFKKILGAQAPVEQALFNRVTLGGFFAGFVSMIATLLLNISPVNTMLTAVALVALLICFYFANYRNALEFASIGASVTISLILFPAMCFGVDNIHNGMPIWLVMGLLITFQLIRGKKVIFFLAAEFLLYTGICIYSYLQFKGTTVELGSEYYLDVWQSVLVTGLGMGLIIREQINVYGLELKKNEEQRIQMEVLKVEAEKASIAKSEFLANMSHEIRTPMNAIMGMTRIALREDIPSSVRDNLEDILNSSNFLLSIINDILDFSKIEAGEMEIIPSNYHLSSLLYDVTTIVHFRIKEKPIEFIQDIDPTVPNTLYGDENRIKQILTNVLGNAAKFTEKGSITLKLDWRREGENAVLVISISDTGQGIRKENLESLFKRFKRLEMNENRNVEGTGLGLVITKQLVSSMGGSIDVESIYGVGSKFTITLPQKIINDGHMYGEDSKQRQFSHDKQKYLDNGITFLGAKLLVVDDSEMNLKVIKGLLEPYQMAVDCANGAKECLEMVGAKKYDLILLDHMMPEMDGVEVLWRMREDEDFNIPVVALTANAVSGARKMYLDWGFADYISKPIHIEEMETCLKKYLSSFMTKASSQKTETIKFASKDYGGKEQEEIEDTAGQKETVMPQEAESDIGAAQPQDMDWDKSELDVNEGLEYALGKIPFYIETLNIYLDETTRNEQLMTEYLQAEDMKNYAVLVHALKSNSRLIGAMAMGDFAADMEQESKKDNLEYIKEHHDAMIELLNRTRDHVRKYMEMNPQN